VIHTQDPDFTLYQGDVLEELAGLPDGSVHCVVTSPPYWGLRDYGTGLWDGGDPDCDHIYFGGGPPESSTLDGAKQRGRSDPGRLSCKCGARRQDHQLGLEPTPDEYVARIVEVFREVRRVLRSDGTCWVNLGDSYNSGAQFNGNKRKDGSRSDALHGGDAYAEGGEGNWPGHRALVPGFKPKDLVGIPWRIAFALQADDWYLRADIIWSKPNPMPESVTDRPTKAHEYVFLLTKSPRYYFDQEAVREPHKWEHVGEYRLGERSKNGGSIEAPVEGRGNTTGSFRAFAEGGRNIRSVWEIATQPYPEAHFATYPEELVRRCILAGSPEGGTVLDPFLGSGTTAYVARKHGRRSIGIELNPDYCKLAAKRMQQQSLFAEPLQQSLFAEV
jgi:DNA modification methylase